MSAQKPLELILARNLLSIMATPAALHAEDGTLLFYNEAAAAIVGRRFEETGAMSPEQWMEAFAPEPTERSPSDYEELPLTISLREGRPLHTRFRIRHAGGGYHEVAASGIPIIGPRGSSGAIIVFWPEEDQENTNVGERPSATADHGSTGGEQGEAR